MIYYSFIGYVIACAIILLIAIGEYRLLMENKVNPSVNRKILLLIMMVSVLMPFIIALVPNTTIKTNVEIGEAVFGGIVKPEQIDISQENGISYFKIFSWITWIYIVGMVMMFIYSCFAFARLFVLMKHSKITELNGTKVYLHNSSSLSSFSWLNRIFLFNNSLEDSEEDLNILLSHELSHLNKGHWIDLAFAQLFLIFQWFNPAAWFIRSELQRLHEYEADEAVLSSGIEEKKYQMLLIRNISRTRFSGLIDGLNNCSLKKRIIMMKKTDFKRDWIHRGIVVGISLIFGGAIIHLPAVASVLEISENSPEIIQETITLKSNHIDTEYENSLQLHGNEMENSPKPEEYIASSNIKKREISKESDSQKVNVMTKESFKSSYVSEKKNNSTEKENARIANYPDAYLSVDKVAQYEGGQSQLMKDLIETINYPEEAYSKGIEGRVVVRFQINPDGKICNCEVAYSKDPILDRAAVKAVEDLPNRWIPAEVDGKPVASVYNIPVSFKLSSDPLEKK